MAEPEHWKIGFEQLSNEISALVASFPPPFMYINDATSPRTIGLVISALLDNIRNQIPAPSKDIYHARINAVACFTARLLYDTVLNALAKWSVTWDTGCANWGLGGDSRRLNDSFDGFIHGLRTLSAHFGDKDKEKGKGKENLHAKSDGARLVIVVENAERLKETMPEFLVPLTRLAELTQLDLTVIFISEVRWEDMRPPFGASPEPYFIDIGPPTKETIIRRVTSKFLTSEDNSPGPYHPSLRVLYSHFITVLCDVCYPFTHDTQDFEYFAAARWPGFVQPVLDDYQRVLEARNDDMDVDEAPGQHHRPLPPSEEVRMRLVRLFTPSLNAALEELYPRLTNASDWAVKNKPERDLLAKDIRNLSRLNDKTATHGEDGTQALPRMSKFILVAAYLASTNPAKSDLRMFGRGLDEKKRKRRARKTAKSGPAKVPQRLLGPLAFPLDRILAILGALVEENDAETRLPAPEYTIPGEYTDMETSRVRVYSAIMELTMMCLLHRTTPADRIDGPPMFKCGISHDVALGLAKQLSIPLNDLMWDPV